MKQFFVAFLLCMTVSVMGQKIDFGLSVGTGKSYLFESIDKSVKVNYGLPMSIMTEAKFTPKGKKWGIKLRLHSVESNLNGENWVNKTPLYGYINSLTTSLLLENEIQKNKYSFGCNLGFGLTKETIQPQQYNSTNKTETNYSSFSLGGHITYKLNNDLDFQILPTFLWQDPFKCIGVLTGSRRANFAEEDLTLLVNFGLRYRLLR